MVCLASCPTNILVFSIAFPAFSAWPFSAFKEAHYLVRASKKKKIGAILGDLRNSCKFIITSLFLVRFFFKAHTQ